MQWRLPLNVLGLVKRVLYRTLLGFQHLNWKFGAGDNWISIMIPFILCWSSPPDLCNLGDFYTQVSLLFLACKSPLVLPFVTLYEQIGILYVLKITFFILWTLLWLWLKDAYQFSALYLLKVNETANNWFFRLLYDYVLINVHQILFHAAFRDRESREIGFRWNYNKSIV